MLHTHPVHTPKLVSPSQRYKKNEEEGGTKLYLGSKSKKSSNLLEINAVLSVTHCQKKGHKISKTKKISKEIRMV